MSNTVSLVQTLDDREVVKQFQRQITLLDKLEKKISGVANQVKKVPKGPFEQASQSALKLLGIFTGVSGVYSAVQVGLGQLRRELDTIRTRQGDAGLTQVEAAKQERAYLLNLGAEKGKAFDTRIEQISNKTGVSRRTIFQAASAAQSSKGTGITEEQAFQAVEQAARINPYDAEAITTIATGILNQQKKAGGSAADVAGFQLAVKNRSPVVEDTMFAQNIAPGIADLVSVGNTPRESAALLVALGQGASDDTGRSTRTAAIQFANQLAELVPTITGTLNQLKYVQETPALRQSLLGTMDDQLKATLKDGSTGDGGELTGEAKFLSTFRSLLQADEGTDNSVKKNLRDALAAIPDVEQGSQLLNSQLADVNARPLQQVAMLELAGKSTVEGIQLNDPGGQTAILRKQIEDISKATGQTDLGQQLTKLMFDARGGLVNRGQEPAIEILSKLEQEQRGGRQRAVYGGGRFSGSAAGPSVSFERIPATPTELNNADAIKNLIETIKTLDATLKQNNATTAENTSATAANNQATTANTSATRTAPTRSAPLPSTALARPRLP